MKKLLIATIVATLGFAFITPANAHDNPRGFQNHKHGHHKNYRDNRGRDHGRDYNFAHAQKKRYHGDYKAGYRQAMNDYYKARSPHHRHKISEYSTYRKGDAYRAGYYQAMRDAKYKPAYDSYRNHRPYKHYSNHNSELSDALARMITLLMAQ